MSPSVYTTLQDIWVILALLFSVTFLILLGEKLSLTLVMICISLTIKNFQHLFKCLTVIYMVSGHIQLLSIFHLVYLPFY